MSIRMAPSKKRVAKKTTTRKTTTKKAPAKKAPAKKAPAKKAPAKKAPAKKAPAKKAPAKKAPAKKAPAKKAPVRAKKALIKKTPMTRRGDGPAWVAPFLSALPPVDAEAPDEERLEALADRVPPPLMEAWRRVGWGRFGDGFVVLVDPQELEEVLDEWLGGPNATRVPLGRTALGDLLYFRDLRERARQLGFTGDVADNACDVNVVDVRYKRVSRLSTSVADFFSSVLGNVDELEGTMRKDLFDAALPRLGQPERHEMYGFVPALALGGSENPESLQRVRAREHLSLLFQL